MLAGYLQLHDLFGKTKEIILAYGADRIVFGDDFPMWDHGAEIWELLSLGLTEEEYQKIFSANAKQILGLSEGKDGHP